MTTKAMTKPESKLLSGPNASYSSGTTLGTNNNVGSAPPDNGDAAYWLFFDLKIQCAVTIGRTVPNTPSTAVLWGSNDPDGSWTYVNTGKYGDLREVSGAGYRYYAYSRTDNTTVGPDDLSITNGPNVYFPTSSPGLPVLAFASDKDLAKLQLVVMRSIKKTLLPQERSVLSMSLAISV